MVTQPRLTAGPLFRAFTMYAAGAVWVQRYKSEITYNHRNLQQTDIGMQSYFDPTIKKYED